MNRPAILLTCLALAACGGGGGGSDTEPCTVSIQQFGDSTQRHQGDNLQAYLDRTLGKGRAEVTNLGRSGTTVLDKLPAAIRSDAIVTANFGINDFRHGVPVAEYKAGLRALSPDVFITPNPPKDAYAPAMREVAEELRRPVIDVSEFVRAMPDWEAHVTDSIHPDSWLYQVIAEKAVGPAMRRLVKEKCE